MKFKHIFLSTLMFLLCICYSFGQVSKVKYFIKFNEGTCLYDMCLVIVEGTGTTTIQRAQFNSQISIVVPTGSLFTIEKLYLPLQGNQNYSGTKPLTWFVNNFVASPQSKPDSDFIGIAPTLNPTAFYNNLKPTDTLVLFSASIKGINKCGEGIRMYENGIDPDSSAPGMNGGDFSNGFTMGSLEQKYIGNVPTKYPSKPIVNHLTTSCVGGLNISFDTQNLACHGGGNTYLWKGPNGFTSTTKNVSIPNATSANDGQYILHIADAFGCKDTILVNATTAPDAGPDQYVKCFSNGKANLSSIANGSWAFVPSKSVGQVSIAGNLNGNTIELSQFSAKGNYTFVRGNVGCIDTVKIFVDDICACSPGNYISQPAIAEFCGSVSDIQISGNDLPGANYLWLYQLNSNNIKKAAGLNIFRDFSTLTLGVGKHSFRRVYNNADFTCADTSQSVVIIVKEGISVGPNVVIDCFEEAVVDLSSVGTGYWTLGSHSAGTAVVNNLYANQIKISQFSKPGLYYMIWSNDICSDTITINAKPLCGCIEAIVAETYNVCKDEKVVLNGSCPNGNWNILGNPIGVKLDSVKLGNAHLSIDWKNAPKTFKAIFHIVVGSEIISDTTILTLRTNPKIDAGFDFDYCRGSAEVIVSAYGGHHGFIWSNGSTNRYLLVSPLVTTKYIVEAQNEFGCKGRDTMTIFVHEKPKGQIPAVLRAKVGDKLVLSAGFWTEAMQYIWTGPNNFESQNKIVTFNPVNLTHAGVYTLTVVSGFDCYEYVTVKVEISNNVLDDEHVNKIGNTVKVVNRSDDNKSLSSSKLNIFPNPAFDVITIHHSLSDIGEIQILDLTGRLVLKTDLDMHSAITTIDISHLTAGSYCVRHTDNGFSQTSSLVVVR